MYGIDTIKKAEGFFENTNIDLEAMWVNVMNKIRTVTIGEH